MDGKTYRMGVRAAPIHSDRYGYDIVIQVVEDYDDEPDMNTNTITQWVDWDRFANFDHEDVADAYANTVSIIAVIETIEAYRKKRKAERAEQTQIY